MPITKNEPGLWIEQVMDALLNASNSTRPTIADPRLVKHSIPLDYVNQSPIPEVRSAVPLPPGISLDEATQMRQRK